MIATVSVGVNKMSKLRFTYYSAKRKFIPFGDGMTMPKYELDRFQSEYVRNYSTPRGRANHVGEFVNDIKRHRIVDEIIHASGTRIIVAEDNLGYIALVIQEVE